MLKLSITCAILLIIPFVFAYLHSRKNPRILTILLYYRYFMIFNMIIAGLFVTSRMFFDGPHAAEISGWAYSPIYRLYAASVFSMVIMAMLCIFSRRIILLAPAICWSAFLLLSTMLHIHELDRHLTNAIYSIYVHIAYNLLVVFITLTMAHRLNSLFRRQIAEKESTATSN